MHFHFPFTTVQVLWTLTFAGHLVLLVVLLGRERIRRFPWFTTSIVLMTLRLLASRLLFGRLPRLTLSEIFIGMADIAAVVSLLVLVELARHTFGKVTRRAWIVAAVVLLAIGGGVLATWGNWPSWKTVAFNTLLARLEMLQLFSLKMGLLVDVLTILLGLLVILFGRRYGAGWRSHGQQIMIGLSTASLGQLGVQAIWERIVKTTVPHSMADYERVMGLRDKLFNGDSVVYLLVVVWWIVCLWIDEPGKADLAAVAVPVGDGGPEREMSAAVEPPGPPSQS